MELSTTLPDILTLLVHFTLYYQMILYFVLSALNAIINSFRMEV